MKNTIASFILMLPVAAIGAEAEQLASPAPEASVNQVADPAAELAGRVSAIANDAQLSALEKRKRITQEVKAFISVGVAELEDRNAVSKIVVDYTVAAIVAAPAYRDAVVQSLAEVPALTAFDGLVAQVTRTVDRMVPVASFAPVGSAAQTQNGSESAFRGNNADTVISVSR